VLSHRHRNNASKYVRIIRVLDPIFVPLLFPSMRL
jgi:hypothetical protein